MVPAYATPSHFWVLQYIQQGFPGTLALKTRDTSREQLAPRTGSHRRCRSQGTAILRKVKRCPSKKEAQICIPTTAPVLEGFCNSMCSYMYSHGLKLRMPAASNCGRRKECREQNLEKPSWTAMFKCRIFTGSFGNEPSVGTLCEDSQVILKMSAAHRMPPAQTPAQNSRSRQKSEPHIFRILDLRSVFCT